MSAESTFLFCLILCIAFMGKEILAKPFLFNAPKAITTFITSASASSSTPDEPYTNIADLTKEKSQKLREREDGDNTEDEQKDKPQKTEDEVFEDNFLPPDVTNEANPSFFSKKINKILGKLKFIADLSAPFQETEANDDIEDFGIDSEDTPKNMTETERSRNKTEEMSARNIFPVLRIRTESSPGYRSGYFSGYSYMKPRSGLFGDGGREPLEGENDDDLDVKKSSSSNNKVKKAALQDSDPTGNDGNKFNLNPQSVGLYFMELLASAVGLVYGAVAQLQNQGNRPS